MALALLDSSALIAYLVAGDTLHRDAVETIESAVREGRSLAISAVTWSEVLHGAQLGHLEEAVVREFVDDLGVVILPVDVRVAEAAASLQGAYAAGHKRAPRSRLRTPDALILATSVVNQDIELVIGGDSKWSGVRGLSAQVQILHEQGTAS